MIRERLGKELLYFDGGMGTLLQAKGLQPGELPETWNVTHADEIKNIHKQYISAGSDIVLANTFGANALKFHCDDFPLEEIIRLAIRHVKDAAEEASGGRRIYTALDVGPTGKLLKPMGDLDFETAYETFKEVMILGEKAGADLIHIETMSDTYELKAAVLAAKENTSLPVFATTIFDERGKLLTGADVPSVVAMLEGLRIDALGINCGMGPEQMLPILEQIMKYSSVPVIVKPNAGLPKQKDGETYYDVSPEEFASVMRHVVDLGAVVIGGCCGTTPAHIAEMVKQCKDIPVKPIEKKSYTVVSSYGQSVFLGTGSKIIGERINPTGKKRFKQALKEHDLDYILKEGIAKVILVGNEEAVKKSAAEDGYDISGAQIVDPATSEKTQGYIDKLVELRQKKGMTPDQAKEILLNQYLYYGVMMVKMGDADGMVSGACHSTADTLRPCLQILKTKPGTKLVSAFFLMVVPNCEYGANGAFVFADSGLNQNPTSEELAAIAASSAESFELLVQEKPIVAMLSHSTKGSAKHPDVDKMVEATRIAKEEHPELKLDGEFQLDAAIVPSVGASKAPGSEVAGKANVLVFPDLDAGNIGYKLAQRLGKAEAYGPVTQGIAKPVNDLSRGCSADDIVGVVAITAVQCQAEDK